MVEANGGTRNRNPPAYEAGALPLELRWRGTSCLVGTARLERAQCVAHKQGLSLPRTPFRHIPEDGYPGRDSNSQNPAFETGMYGISITWVSIGAGTGNRTRILGLEGCCSTIELHAQEPDRRCPDRTDDLFLVREALSRLS